MTMPTVEITKKTVQQGFREELAECWKALPNKTLFFTLLALWLALFQFLGNSTFGYVDTASLFYWMYDSYNAPISEDGHGNLIPFVVLGLFWWKRDILMAAPKRNWSPAMVGIAGALVLHVLGYIAQQPRISIVALFTGIYFLMGLAWGPEWLKRSFFPFFLFAFCVPLGSLAESITFPLRMVVASISTNLSQHGLGIEVIRDGTRLFDRQGTFQYDVAPACSGIRSLISLFALTTIYGFVTFQKTWKRLLMVLIALPLAIVGNVARITGVIVMAEAFGQNAGIRFHDSAGFMTFLVAIICIMALGYWLREEKKTTPVPGGAL